MISGRESLPARGALPARPSSMNERLRIVKRADPREDVLAGLKLRPTHEVAARYRDIEVGILQGVERDVEALAVVQLKQRLPDLVIGRDRYPNMPILFGEPAQKVRAGVRHNIFRFAHTLPPASGCVFGPAS